MSELSSPPSFLAESVHQLADGLYQGAERLAHQLDAAAQAVVLALTHGGRVLCAGEAEAALLASHMADLLVKGRLRPRPPLAALALQAPSDAENAGLLDARLRALGQPGDVWLAFSLEAAEAELAMATATAREMDLTLVVLTGESAATLGPMVRDTDVWVPLPGLDRTQLFSTAWLAVHLLADAIDAHLLGEEEV